MSGEQYKEVNVIEPNGVVQVFKNYWWWCVEGDPTRALFYAPGKRDVGSPQCNFNHALALRIGESLAHEQRAKLIQIPLAFAPWDTSNER